MALTLLPCAAAVPGARSEPFSEWCGQQGIPDPLKTPMRDSICERMVSSASALPQPWPVSSTRCSIAAAAATLSASVCVALCVCVSVRVMTEDTTGFWRG